MAYESFILKLTSFVIFLVSSKLLTNLSTSLVVDTIGLVVSGVSIQNGAHMAKFHCAPFSIILILDIGTIFTKDNVYETTKKINGLKQKICIYF